MSRLLRSAAVLALAAVLTARPARAQCGPCSVALLHVDGGVRPAGLGGAYYAGDGPSMAFYNPAQVGSNAGVALDFMRIAGAHVGEFAVTGRYGRWGLGAQVRAASGGVPPVDADSTHLAGGTVVAGLSAATSVHGVWVGASAKYAAPAQSATGVADFDAGIAVRRFGLLFGLAAQDLGPDLVAGALRQPLPTRVSLGATLPERQVGTYFDFSASAALTRERGGELVPKGGAELDYIPVSGWQFAARIGAQRVVRLPGELVPAALTVGGSFTLDNLSVDYAFSPAVAGGVATHRIGLRLQ